MGVLLLYGATGFSGRLVASAAQRLRAAGRLAGVKLLLAGRDRAELAALSDRTGFPHVVFALDDRAQVLSALKGVNVVLNAAGPFDATAPRLARSALECDAHYVDLNGEVDVYRALDDLAPIAVRRGVSVVCGAGRIAAVSDILLDGVLSRMTAEPRHALTTVRIVHGMVRHLSRGSVRTSVQALREQVCVIRQGAVRRVPVGQIERVFDLPAFGNRAAQPRALATATNFLDTLVAQRTSLRHGLLRPDIETYMQMGDLSRMAYELGALGAGLWRLPLMDRLIDARIAALPEGPTPEQQAENRQIVVVELEDRSRAPVARIAADTPDPYVFSADIFLAIALRLLALGAPAPAKRSAAKIPGWWTPSEALGDAGPQVLLDLGVELRLLPVAGVSA